MAARLQGTDVGHRLLHPAQWLLGAGLGVGEAQRPPLLLAGLIQDHRFVAALADAYPDDMPASSSRTLLRAGRGGRRDSASLSIALCVRRGLPATCSSMTARRAEVAIACPGPGPMAG
jgi:hypothetical protein